MRGLRACQSRHDRDWQRPRLGHVAGRRDDRQTVLLFVHARKSSDPGRTGNRGYAHRILELWPATRPAHRARTESATPPETQAEAVLVQGACAVMVQTL